MTTLVEKLIDKLIICLGIVVGILLAFTMVCLLSSIFIEAANISTGKDTIKKSIGGDGYYWLSTPFPTYTLKVKEVEEIPIKIHTPNEIHLEQIKEEMAFEIFKKPRFFYSFVYYMSP